MATFKDISTFRRSEVWDYFDFSQELQQAKCKICKVLLKTPGSTTSTITRHLKTKHKIEVLKCNTLASEAVETSRNPKIPRVETFFSSGLKTLPEILSRLTAIDGISFTIIANSQVLRSAFCAQGDIIPKSHQTVSDLVMKYFEKVKK